jgi:hypothetical protein
VDVATAAAAADVGARTSDEEVIAVFTQQDVLAAAAREPVVAGPADQTIVSRASAGAIDVDRALELVVPAESEEDVAAEAARELVGPRCADDRDRAAEAEDELVGPAVAVGAGRPALVGAVASRATPHRGAVDLERVGRGRPSVLSEAPDPRFDTREVARHGEPAAHGVRDVAPEGGE